MKASELIADLNKATEDSGKDMDVVVCVGGVDNRRLVAAVVWCESVNQAIVILD